MLQWYDNSIQDLVCNNFYIAIMSGRVIYTQSMHIPVNPYFACMCSFILYPAYPIRVATVNREYFVVKIFSDSLACAKIKCLKYVRNINYNIMQYRVVCLKIDKIIVWTTSDIIFAIYGTNSTAIRRSELVIRNVTCWKVENPGLVKRNGLRN